MNNDRMVEMAELGYSGLAERERRDVGTGHLGDAAGGRWREGSRRVQPLFSFKRAMTILSVDGGM